MPDIVEQMYCSKPLYHCNNIGGPTVIVVELNYFQQVHKPDAIINETRFMNSLCNSLVSLTHLTYRKSIF